MRFLPTAAFMLLIAGCGSTPIPVSTPTRVVVSERAQRGGLIGLDANALATRFGQPRLRVREGDGTKLQFGGGTCLLDAYLYPATSGGGVSRVTHIDTRDRDGRIVEQSNCIAMIEQR